jgi:hypothetical protein
MTISAFEGSAPSDVLERNLELYRDLFLALKERVALIRAAAGEDAGCKETVEAVKAHHKALQTVLELEASLVKRSRSWTDAGGGELDLAAARAEIAARLAAWAGAG